jgi:Polyketide cyclase / dehydrase and lipid transport
MIVVDARIRIQRDIDEVFTYVANPENFPEWNSAVTDVRPLTLSTYVMTRDLPTGGATNELEVVARDRPARFSIGTTSGPTPFHYEYTFSSDEDATSVELHALADLGPVGNLLGPLARHGLAKGIQDNLVALRHILLN